MPYNYNICMLSDDTSICKDTNNKSNGCCHFLFIVKKKWFANYTNEI